MFLRRLLQQRKECRLLMLGLDASGRTTTLYQMKLCEVVTTIPTIGFNVEDVDYKNFHFTCWDVGGCDKIRPLWRHYYQNTQGIIYFIDSNDKERMEETVDELKKILREDELHDARIVIYCNKQDLPGAMKPQEIIEKYNIQDTLKGRRWAYFGTIATTGYGVYEGLDWFQNELSSNQNNSSSSKSSSSSLLRLLHLPHSNTKHEHGPSSSSSSSSTVNDPYAIPSEADLLVRVTTEDKNEVDPNRFLELFQKGTISVFDHKAHLRIGFLVLYKSANEGLRNSQAVKVFMDLLQDFFKHAPRNQIRQTFHVTMTMFWCQIIHLCLASFLLHNNDNDNDSNNDNNNNNIESNNNISVSDGGGGGGYESYKENRLFMEMLKANPILMWSSLWSLYYSKEVLMSPTAKQSFVLPDKKPFPSVALQTLSHLSQNLHSDILIHERNNTANNNGSGSDNEGEGGRGGNRYLQDDEFYDDFHHNRLEEFDEESLVRICYLTLRDRVIRDGERRGKVIAELLSQLQSNQIKYNGKNAKRGLPTLPYSETISYFWFQLLSAALSSITFPKHSIYLLTSEMNDNNNDNNDNNDNNGDKKKSGGDEKKEEDRKMLSRIPFRMILSLFPELQPNNKPWENYYSENVFYSIEARRQFVNPNKKPLPNYFSQRETNLIAVDDAQSSMLRPPMSVFLSLIETISHLPETLNDFKYGGLVMGYEVEDDEVFVEFVRSRRLSFFNHYTFLRFIFSTIKLSWEAGERGTLSVTRIVDELELYFNSGSDSDNGGGGNSGGGGLPSAEILQLNDEVIHKLGGDQRMMNEILRCDVLYQRYQGLSFTHFWIQMVMSSIVQATYRNPHQLLSFQQFISYSPELLWLRLWSLFYSESLLFSQEAKVIVLPPDRHKLPSFIRK